MKSKTDQQQGNQLESSGYIKQAMILAAGQGRRMYPLTQTIAKPLIPIGNKPLIEYHIEALVSAGITRIIINLHHHTQQIQAHLGQGEKFGVAIHYSYEQKPLEMVGGIVKALPLLGKEPFIVISGDTWTRYCFKDLAKLPLKENLAHLVLAKPMWGNLIQDFSLEDGQYLIKPANHRSELPGNSTAYTFAGIGCYQPQFFENLPPNNPITLSQALKPYLGHRLITGEIFLGPWCNVNTLNDLTRLKSYTQTT